MKGPYRRLCIFGGTFNPIHLGHLRLAEEVYEEFGLDKIIFIPTNIPPHKSIKEDILPSHRLKMVEFSIKGNDHFLPEDVEIRRGGTSYTIDTIKYIYDNYRFEERPYWIIGSDLVEGIDTWKDISQVLKRIFLIILLRDHYPIDDSHRLKDFDGASFLYFGKRKIDITSSEIRERCRSGKSIRYLVTDEVFNYIKENMLYV